MITSLVMLLTSCGKSIYDLPRATNQDLTVENIQQQELMFETMVNNSYSTFSSGFIVHKDATQNPEQGVENGIVYIIDYLAGIEITVPKYEPVLYHKGPKKGEPALYKNGKTVVKEFLVPIVDAEIDPVTGIAERFFVQIGSDSIGDLFPMKKVRFEHRTTTNPNSVLRTKRGVQGKTYSVHRYKFDLLKYEKGLILPKNLFVQESDKLVTYVDRKSRQRYYIIVGSSGSWWFINEKFKDTYLDKFSLDTSTDESQKKKFIAKSKTLGSQ